MSPAPPWGDRKTKRSRYFSGGFRDRLLEGVAPRRENTSKTSRFGFWLLYPFFAGILMFQLYYSSFSIRPWKICRSGCNRDRLVRARLMARDRGSESKALIQLLNLLHLRAVDLFVIPNSEAAGTRVRRVRIEQRVELLRFSNQ